MENKLPEIRSINEGLATLTSINSKVFTKLSDLAIYCITDEVNDSHLMGVKLTSVDIGIGILHIYEDGDKVKYGFVPSAKLEEGVRNTIIRKENALEVVVESTLKNKLVNTYKELV